jgi:hypothetical protein
MSDFLKSLSARSFGLAGGAGNVRPRLPSLYETPQGRLGKHSNQVLQAPITSLEADTLQNEVTPHSSEQNFQVTENSKARSKTAGSVSALVSNDAGAKPNTGSGLDRLPASSQTILQAKKHNFLSGPEKVSRVNSENRPLPATRPNEGYSTPKKLTEDIIATLNSAKAGIEPDNKAVSPVVFSGQHLEKRVPQAHSNAEQSMEKQPSKLLTDASVLERMVTEKIALHAKTHPSIGDLSGKALSTQKENLSLADLAQFHIKRPGIKPLMPDLENKNAGFEHNPVPTIQVTIGRIEVRATQPAKAATKNVDKKPSSMSLEEYLAKRNGGIR